MSLVRKMFVDVDTVRQSHHHHITQLHVGLVVVASDNVGFFDLCELEDWLGERVSNKIKVTFEEIEMSTTTCGRCGSPYKNKCESIACDAERTGYNAGFEDAVQAICEWMSDPEGDPEQAKCVDAKFGKNRVR